ncbi:MAG: redox-regulated ATPase YchF [Oscillospiraceae bacterium]|nr:redox-regulated ATPase YchF [Oscillospiraceae bacterium]
MKLGIVGLPNVGKSTLFNAITNAGAESANYPFCTIDPNVGVVTVPDSRLDWLSDFYKPKKTTPAVVEFVDIAGLVKGASRGAGLGNKFLANIRECAAIVHVVRCFDDENIMHVVADASTNVPVDPMGDIETIDLELIMADVEMVERRIDKANKAAKADKKYLHEAEVFSGLKDWLNDGKSARTYLGEVDEEDAELLRTAELLSLKPVIYAANLDEAGFADPDSVEYYKLVSARAAEEGAQCIPVCAKLEAEIAELDGEEKAMFLEDLGIAESGLDRLIKASYALLGLISFLTAGEDECRAWTITRGTKAPQAAGKIHSDFERGFIRAETVAFEDLQACGSMAAAREKGLIRSEGKEYVVKDGDIILFRFNV